MTPYQTRPVHFLQVLDCAGWKIKLYHITAYSENSNNQWVSLATSHLDKWLQQRWDFGLASYYVATLVVHQGREGCFAILSWWTDENMLQLQAYKAGYEGDPEFRLISDKGLVSCVWELAVLWHERNAWVQHILQKSIAPDFDAYLNDHFSGLV